MLSERASAATVVETGDPRLAPLKSIIVSHSLLTGEFVLSSGRQSSYLFQLRQTTLHPEGSFLLGDIVIDFMKSRRLSAIGGLELGAVPFVTAVAVASHFRNFPVAAFFVRKAAKQHGAQELINGHLPDGGFPLVVDDVTTTGGSILKAVAAVQERKCRVTTALSIVDREEGAADALARAGIRLHSIFRKSEFSDHLPITKQ
ncbi:MAG TPA: orotate phosphoribosyltransferase [Aestuariivirgaceae bacterium]